jgi:hypothetical protein
VGTATATHFAGIDVLKDALDARLLGPDGRAPGKPFPDDRRGHTASLARADRLAPGV